MHIYKWTPDQVFGLTLDDFAFAVTHTGKVAKEIQKARK